MKYISELLTPIVVFLLLLFLKKTHLLTGSFSSLPILLLMTILFTIIILYIEKRTKENFQDNKLNYEAIDVTKFICAIIIIILHLRPFLGVSNQLDILFTNIVSRVCVPFFFVVTGYFVSKKEIHNSDYTKNYIKSMIKLYLVWNVIYTPVILSLAFKYIPVALATLKALALPIYFFIPLIIIAIPVVIIVVFLYTGTYYHLWYFPALFLSLFVLDKWKSKFNIKYLLYISFILLLFGATETYYGIFPQNIQVLLSYYFNIFFTTRNFLFFGLFYVVLGYYIGKKNNCYVNHSFLKLIICVFLLGTECLWLQLINRIDSNILLSCVPLVYYLFVTVIYSNRTYRFKSKYTFRELSKYYYLVHPMIIFLFRIIIFDGRVISIGLKGTFLEIIIIIILTHIVSIIIINIKKRYPKLIL